MTLKVYDGEPCLNKRKRTAKCCQYQSRSQVTQPDRIIDKISRSATSVEREVFFVLRFGTSVQELHKMKHQNFLFMPNFALFLDIVSCILSAIAASKKNLLVFIKKFRPSSVAKNITQNFFFDKDVTKVSLQGIDWVRGQVVGFLLTPQPFAKYVSLQKKVRLLPDTIAFLLFANDSEEGRLQNMCAIKN